jgi:hypothetical protein
LIQSIHVPPILEEHRRIEVCVIHVVKLFTEFGVLVVKFKRADEIAGNVVGGDRDRHDENVLRTVY